MEKIALVALFLIFNQKHRVFVVQPTLILEPRAATGDKLPQVYQVLF